MISCELLEYIGLCDLSCPQKLNLIYNITKVAIEIIIYK